MLIVWLTALSIVCMCVFIRHTHTSVILLFKHWNDVGEVVVYMLATSVTTKATDAPSHSLSLFRAKAFCYFLGFQKILLYLEPRAISRNSVFLHSLSWGILEHS